MTGNGQILHCTAWSWEFARNLSNVLKTNKDVISETYCKITNNKALSTIIVFVATLTGINSLFCTCAMFGMSIKYLIIHFLTTSLNLRYSSMIID